jgi:hypothetical protein
MDAIKQLYIDKQVIKSRREDSLNTCSKLLIDNLSVVEPRWELWRRVNQQGIAVPVDTTESEEILIHDILFDSGASHHSYISKQLVDRYRKRWKNSIRKVKAEVILGDNTTTLKIDEEITLNMSFFSPLSNKKVTKTIKMLLINAPGKTIIIGLPDIVDHYYDLFLEMIKAAKNDLTLAYENKKSIKTFDSINLRNNFDEVDLKLPIEGLEEPFVPWKDNPWVISPEELLTPEPCSFTGPLAYLSVSHDEAVKDYHELLKTHISEEFRETAPKLMELMRSNLALEVFVPKTWMGVNAPPLKFETLPGMPTHMKPAARPINKRIYDSAKTEVDRMLTYFYV